MLTPESLTDPLFPHCQPEAQISLQRDLDSVRSLKRGLGCPCTHAYTNSSLHQLRGSTTGMPTYQGTDKPKPWHPHLPPSEVPAFPLFHPLPPSYFFLILFRTLLANGHLENFPRFMERKSLRQKYSSCTILETPRQDYPHWRQESCIPGTAHPQICKPLPSCGPLFSHL